MLEKAKIRVVTLVHYEDYSSCDSSAIIAPAIPPKTVPAGPKADPAIAPTIAPPIIVSS